MKNIRRFKIENRKYDPRKKLNIFLTKTTDGFYIWGCFTYDGEVRNKKGGNPPLY